MSMQQAYHNHSVYGMIYEFENIGDKILMHSHASPRDDAHNIICLRGRVKLKTPGSMVEITAGTVIDFDSTVMHEIIAAERGAKILTIYIHGRPSNFVEGYMGHF